MESIKVKFVKNHSPRRAGEVVEFTGREGMKLANWYLNTGIAQICDCDGKTTGCADCEKKKQEAKESIDPEKTANVTIVEAELAEKPKLKDLRKQYPHIKATSVDDFLRKIELESEA